MHAYVRHACLHMGVAKSNHTLPPFLSVLSTPAPTASLSVIKRIETGGGLTAWVCRDNNSGSYRAEKEGSPRTAYAQVRHI